MSDEQRKRDANEDAFVAFIRSFGWDEFFGHHWGKKLLHFTSCRQQLEALPGLADFPAMLAGRLTPEGWQQGLFGVQAHYLDQKSDLQNITPVPPGTWAPAFNAGMSLCFGPVDRWDGRLAQLVDDCKRALRFPAGVCATAYLTPRHSGSRMHYDSQHVFFLQVYGAKRWRVSTRPGIVAPPANLVAEDLGFDAVRDGLSERGLHVSAPEECGLTELVLRQGEALYLPPGFWHEARTDAEASLHYTLTIKPVSFAKLLQLHLSTLQCRNVEWREDLHHVADESSLARLLTQQLAELKAALAQVTPADLIELGSAIERQPPAVRELYFAEP